MDGTSVAEIVRQAANACMARKKPSVMKEPDKASAIHPLAVARRLIALREALGLGPSEFADSVGIDRSSYSKIEKGEKPLHQYLAYDVSVRWGVTMEFIYRGATQDRDLPDRYATAIRTNLIGQQR